VIDYVFDTNVVKKKEVVSSMDGFSIDSDEIISLQGTEWLNDQVLNMYIKMINLDRVNDDRYIFLTFLAVSKYCLYCMFYNICILLFPTKIVNLPICYLSIFLILVARKTY
jgi:hypothetical protein